MGNTYINNTIYQGAMTLDQFTADKIKEPRP
jgi:hypothetical protein